MGKPVFSLLFLALFAVAATAADGAPQEADALFDIHGQYAAVKPPQPTADAAKVEVLELFWYGCPHCYHFEPHLKEWLAAKPDYVTFRRMPAVFRKGWIPHAQAYYAAEAMGVLDQVHGPLFQALHEEKRKVFTPDQIADFVAEQGVDREAFLEAYDSFAVKSKVKQAIIMTQRYGITGVPSIVINGKFRTSGSIADGFDGMIKVINVLTEQERQGIQSQHARRDASPAPVN